MQAAIVLLAAAALGGVMNMVRGGLWAGWLQGRGRIINVIAYGLFCGALAFYAQADAVHARALVSAALMYALQAPGYGVYTGTILNGFYMKGGVVVSTPKPEIALIDALIGPLAMQPVLYGFTGATLRGALWGAGLALAWVDMGPLDLSTYSFWPLAGGASLGAAFWLARFWPNHSTQWKVGEALFGAALWASVAFTVLS